MDNISVDIFQYRQYLRNSEYCPKQKVEVEAMESERRWYVCPVCGQKICQFSDEAIAMELYIKCKKCHNEIEIRINRHVTSNSKEKTA